MVFATEIYILSEDPAISEIKSDKGHNCNDARNKSSRSVIDARRRNTPLHGLPQMQLHPKTTMSTLHCSFLNSFFLTFRGGFLWCNSCMEKNMCVNAEQSFDQDKQEVVGMNECWICWIAILLGLFSCPVFHMWIGHEWLISWLLKDWSLTGTTKEKQKGSWMHWYVQYMPLFFLCLSIKQQSECISLNILELTCFCGAVDQIFQFQTLSVRKWNQHICHNNNKKNYILKLNSNVQIVPLELPIVKCKNKRVRKPRNYFKQSIKFQTWMFAKLWQ